jgi:LysM repeat protein
MNSDTKIGLLLGLVFIFIIAFLINGLPNLREDKNDNELTIGLVGSQNAPPGLAAGQRKAHHEVIGRIEPVKEPQPQSGVICEPSGDIRFETVLPVSQAAPEQDIAAAPAVLELPSAEAAKNNQSDVGVQAPPALPQVYIVGDGDSLASIAKKFYGDSDGSRLANIERIFEANRGLLKSADEIYVGQKLTIPALSSQQHDKSKLEQVFSGTIFKKVESVGRRHQPSECPAKQSRQHVVRDGDSLWQIAAEKLGDGARYSEIAELNADIIDDEDTLVVGMRLKIPVR